VLGRRRRRSRRARASRAGADTLVLERGRQRRTSAMSGGVICLGGTALQKACGFEDSTEAMFNT
jgi:3-oxo-5alpha-steroid 4-dehydrogenase